MTNYATEGVYVNDGFLSTSISGDIVEYGENKNYIRIPKGKRIIYLECVTVSGSEFEVLLPPGVKLNHVKQRSKKLHEWTM